MVALDGIDLEVAAGTMIGLIGPDGVIRYARRGKPSPEEVLAAAA